MLVDLAIVVIIAFMLLVLFQKKRLRLSGPVRIAPCTRKRLEELEELKGRAQL